MESERPNCIKGTVDPSGAFKNKSNSIVQFSGKAASIYGVTKVLSAISSQRLLLPFRVETFPDPVLFHLAGKSAIASWIKLSWKITVWPGMKSEKDAPAVIAGEVVSDEVFEILSVFTVVVVCFLFFFLQVILWSFLRKILHGKIKVSMIMPFYFGLIMINLLVLMIIIRI